MGSDKPEKKRKSIFLRFIAVLALVALIATGGLIAATYFVSGLLFEPMEAGAAEQARAAVLPDLAELTAEQERIFEIRPNQTLRSVSQRMVDEGLARSAIAIELYGRFREYASRLQAGRYLVSPQLSPVEILQKIASGDAVFDELTITIPEGWSLNDIELYFEELGLFSKERFAQAAVMQPLYRDFVLLAELETDTILDGYLFPDTYRIFENSTPESIVQRMLRNFHDRMTPEILRQIDASGRSLHETLTLASIVQKEANDTTQMPDIAGVFTNRLRDRIRLESDATVNYVLGTSKRQPTFADTRVAHPYNTYENYGLPPGPIGNPGIDAILASINPAEHEFFFFLHPIDGRIILSRTFAEHLQNKAIYLD
jgi:UPF0755 protein